MDHDSLDTLVTMTAFLMKIILTVLYIALATTD